MDREIDNNYRLNPSLLYDIFKSYYDGSRVDNFNRFINLGASDSSQLISINDDLLTQHIGTDPHLMNSVNLDQYKAAVTEVWKALQKIDPTYYLRDYFLDQKDRVWLGRHILTKHDTMNIDQFVQICNEIEHENERLRDRDYKPENGQVQTFSNNSIRLYIPNKLLVKEEELDESNIMQIVDAFESTDVFDQSEHSESYHRKVGNGISAKASVFSQKDEESQVEIGAIERKNSGFKSSDANLNENSLILRSEIDKIPPLPFYLCLAGELTATKISAMNLKAQQDSDIFIREIFREISTEQIEVVQEIFEDFDHTNPDCLAIKSMYAKWAHLRQIDQVPVNMTELGYFLTLLNQNYPDLELRDVCEKAKQGIAQETISILNVGNPLQVKDLKKYLGDATNQTPVYTFTRSDEITTPLWGKLKQIYDSWYSNAKTGSGKTATKSAVALKAQMSGIGTAFKVTSNIRVGDEKVELIAQDIQVYASQIIECARQADEISGQLKMGTTQYAEQARALLQQLEILTIAAIKIDNDLGLALTDKDRSDVYDKIRIQYGNIVSLMEDCEKRVDKIIKRQTSKVGFIVALITGILAGIGILTAVIAKITSANQASNVASDNFNHQLGNDTHNLSYNIDDNHVAISHLNVDQQTLDTNVHGGVVTDVSTYIPGNVDTSAGYVVGGAVDSSIPPSYQNYMYNGVMIDPHNMTPYQLNVYYDNINTSLATLGSNDPIPGLVDETGHQVTKAEYLDARTNSMNVHHGDAAALFNSNSIITRIETAQGLANADVYYKDSNGNLVSVTKAPDLTTVEKWHDDVGDTKGNSTTLFHKDGTPLTIAQLHNNSTYDNLEAKINSDHTKYLNQVNSFVTHATADFTSAGGHVNSAALTAYLDANPDKIGTITSEISTFNQNYSNFQSDSATFATWASSALADPNHVPALPNFKDPAMETLAQGVQGHINSNPSNAYQYVANALPSISHHQTELLNNSFATLPTGTFTLHTYEPSSPALISEVDNTRHANHDTRTEMGIIGGVAGGSAIALAALGGALVTKVQRENLEEKLDEMKQAFGRKNTNDARSINFIAPVSKSNADIRPKTGLESYENIADPYDANLRRLPLSVSRSRIPTTSYTTHRDLPFARRMSTDSDRSFGESLTSRMTIESGAGEADIDEGNLTRARRMLKKPMRSSDTDSQEERVRA